MIPLDHLISQWPILQTLASYISTVDLLCLALTCKAGYLYILSSPTTFSVLRRDCTCDGRGLVERQAFSGLYSLKSKRYIWGNQRRVWEDEPVEVQLWALKCDEAAALPCLKCGVNVCEECRYYPRERPERPNRRPHLTIAWENQNVMCLCEKCDEKLEEELRGKTLSELCDCDLYRRWICSKCVNEEDEFTYDYYKERTKWSEQHDTKSMGDHQGNRVFYCICGKTVPQTMRPRCTWCKRRHLPETEWERELEEVGRHMPMFEEDDCYPRFVGSRYEPTRGGPYPKLKYNGPIWQG